MTVIEFFDKAPVRNILSALLCDPDRVIYIGGSTKRMRSSLSVYEEVLHNRGKMAEIRSKAVNKHNLESIVKVLTQIVETEESCVFNLDGGEELYLVAVGIIWEKFGDRIQLHRFNLQNNTIVDCDADGNNQLTAPITLSAWEIVRISGGRIIMEEELEQGTVSWDFNWEFCDGIYAMWQLCRKDPTQWNIRIADLERLNELAPMDDLQADFPCGADITSRCTVRFAPLLHLLEQLEEIGVVRDVFMDAEHLTFQVKNEQIKRCLLKAGQLLELYVAVMAMSLEEGDEPLYHDIMSGVYIDWDGLVAEDDGVDVANEIDGILMKGAIPVFISCKNGQVDVGELYKLYTVAQRFGGPHCKKVLVASELDKMGIRGDYVRDRARDMGIRIVEDVDKMEDEEFLRVLRSLWCN